MSDVMNRLLTRMPHQRSRIGGAATGDPATT